MHPIDDTIAAVASAPGGGLRGIVRVSGPRTVAVIAKRFQASSGLELAGVRAAQRVEGSFSIGGSLRDVPCDVYLWPTERSYTRQPTAELHTIGSPFVLEAIVQTLCADGARLAQPGEFTMRAFLAGRLDLTQAEAVLGVIDATSQHDLDVALSQLAGGLAAPLHELRERLLNMLAHLEAGLDFVEEDIEFIGHDELIHGIDEAATAIDSVQQQLQSRTEVDAVACVVLVGSPNVGKSSLLNALVGAAAAIVSEVSGTTRDYVARRIALGDCDVVLIDTAGVEHAGGRAGIPTAAQAITRGKREQATLLLLCLDATRPLNDWEAGELRCDPGTPRLIVSTKTDAGSHAHFNGDVIRTSSLSGQGIPELRQAIYECVADDSRNAVASTALRCHESLRLARTSLDQARLAASDSLGEELVAAELRVVLEELGNVVGAVYTDDILDRIFSRFCIGK
ncbi:MAG: tRNA modification GTPase [Planctomycetota bacterium]|nr:tRNA modification GTPase [Planctomycetota bacterium]